MENPVLKNMGTGQIIEVVKSPFTIGRSLACDYIIEDKIVSRAHFKLNQTDNGWTLIDSSTNGTLVNENIFKGEISPVLKHNDTISLGYDNYTYKFLTEAEKAPNHQVERLRNEEINGVPVALGSDQISSPSTPSSFDENGISDDILNHLADNMLDNVETNIDTKENTVSTQENIPNKPTTSNSSSSVKGNDSVPSQSNSSTNTIIYSLPDDILQTACDNMEVQESNDNREQQNNTVTSSMDQTTNKMSASNSNSLVFTLDNILSKPKQTVVERHDNRDIVSVSMAPVQGTSKSVVPTTTIITAGSTNTGSAINIAPFEPNEQSVVKRHDNRDIVSVSMASIQGTSTTTVPTTAGSTNTGSVTNTAPFKPRDLLKESIEAVVRRYSGLNNSSVNTSASTSGQNTVLSSTGPSGSVPTTLSLSSIQNTNKKIKIMACSPRGSGQRLPTITRLSNSEMQRILATSPQIPIIRLDSLQVRFPASGVQSAAATLANVMACGSTTVPSTVTNIQTGNVDHSNLITVTSSESILTTRLASTNAVPCDSTVEVVDFTALPVGQEVVIENTTDIAEVTNNSNTNQAGQIIHESQEAGPCNKVEKVPNIDLKQANQNQFEEMENEMMCTICANLFIKAVTLGCSHTFCHYCIEQWKKKKSDCPICRNKIASSTRTLVLDNIIEKMLEGMSEEEKQDRKSSLEERTKLEDEEKAKLGQQNTNKNGRGRGGRSGGRGSNRGNQRNNNQNAGNNRPAVPNPNVITIPDSPSPSTTDSDDNDSNGSYDDENNEGDWYDRPYYGGYGRCYSCGDRGHWANGCPYRY